MENPIPFNEAMFMLAGPAQKAWLYWMSFAIFITPVVLAFHKVTWRDAAIVFVANVAMLIGMDWVYQQMGYVRMLGIVHVILWTPLFIYLVLRARDGELPLACRAVMWMFAATLAISLMFDYTDVARYLLGERDSMI